MKKLLPPLLFLLCLIIMATAHGWLPVTTFIPYPYNLAGIAPLLAGLGIASWGSRKFARVGTNIKTFDEPDKLVTDGLFKYSRNPMYLGFVLALAGAAILLGSLPPFFVSLAFLVVADRWYIAFEETAMARKFGGEYEVYKQKTRRWI
jgi:protein-S-isoprenylcysteine O-methyltransferase Ste14